MTQEMPDQRLEKTHTDMVQQKALALKRTDVGMMKGSYIILGVHLSHDAHSLLWPPTTKQPHDKLLNVATNPYQRSQDSKTHHQRRQVRSRSTLHKGPYRVVSEGAALPLVFLTHTLIMEQVKSVNQLKNICLFILRGQAMQNKVNQTPQEDYMMSKCNIWKKL